MVIMKNIRTMAVFLFVFSFYFSSCISEQEKKQIDIENRIYNTLTIQAKSILTNPSTYEFDNMNDYRVNDSIRVFAQKFSGANDFGVRESKYVIGYFNTNTGYEVEESLIQLQASKEELISVKRVINPR